MDESKRGIGGHRPVTISRRRALAAGGAAAAALAGRAAPAIAEGQAAAAPPSPAFAHRGYYLTFMRMPTYGLGEWKRAVDCFASDGINTLVLWMAGGFRSRKFPETWRYNEEHENVRKDFAGDLIKYAQGKGVKVLLGFTPFGYDGANQYTLDRPHLRALKKDGTQIDEFGIHCWGWNLCPSKAESQRFMREYVREMVADFYPGADGLLVESSDYAICHCADCRGQGGRGGFYEREFEFVRAVADDARAVRKDATVVVYPHYFSGSKVPGLDADAARQPFDPRWSLFFTPHSAPVERDLIGKARASLWSDDAPALHGPEAIRARAIAARAAGVTGYVPSLEAFSYVPTRVEEGRRDQVGKRQTPFGFGWLPPERMPFDELPVRVNRVAFREFSQDPALSFDAFKRRLGRDVFGGDFEAAWIDDLLLLRRAFFEGRTWYQPAPLASPDRVRLDRAAGRLKPPALAALGAMLTEVERLTARHAHAETAARRDAHRIGRWLLDRWTAAERELLKAT
jgi:hypothetical protein